MVLLYTMSLVLQSIMASRPTDVSMIAAIRKRMKTLKHINDYLHPELSASLSTFNDQYRSWKQALQGYGKSGKTVNFDVRTSTLLSHIKDPEMLKNLMLSNFTTWGEMDETVEKHLTKMDNLQAIKGGTTTT